MHFGAFENRKLLNMDTYKIHTSFKELSDTLNDYLLIDANRLLIEEVIELCTTTFENDHGVYFCGNGGSAAEAMHLAAEFSGRYKMDRRALKSDCIGSNISFLTAVANDYGYDHVFARGIEAMGNKGDVLFLLSTSGNSKNIVNAAVKANEIGIKTIAFTGKSGGELSKQCTVSIKIPSDNVPRIQELHLLIGHIVCEAVEKNIFQK